MPIDRGCVTQATGGPSDLTFSGQHARVLMTVTPDGNLKFGPGVYPMEVAELLVQEFGHAYESNLRRAEDVAAEATARANSLKSRLATADSRADTAERKAADYRKQVERLENDLRVYKERDLREAELQRKQEEIAIRDRIKAVQEAELAQTCANSPKPDQT